MGPVALTLDMVRAAGSPQLFPRHRLGGCEDALVLFASGFYGKQDAIWLLEAGVRCDCVDIREDTLNVMRALYPDDWSFLCVDAFAFLHRTHAVWDVVTVDCPSNLFDRCADIVDQFCARARKMVVLGTGVNTLVIPPLEWQVAEVIHRSSYLGGTYWTVLEPA